MQESKRILSALIPLALVAPLALSGLPAAAERGDDADRASKNGKTEGTVGGVSVVLEYGRPKVKERQIWGGLVPWGKLWRTGADEATTVTFGGDVTVEGQALAAGTYALFTIPGESEWTVVFNQTAQQWGAYNYDAGKDALRVTVEPRAHEHVEELDFVIEGDEVVLYWEKLAVPIAVAAGG
jgi:hypothetical protein